MLNNYLVFLDSIEVYDGGLRQIPPSVNATAQIFATYPQDFTSSATCFLDQVTCLNFNVDTLNITVL